MNKSEQIKNIITGYCVGRNELHEFYIDDLDKMVSDIEKLYESKNESEKRPVWYLIKYTYADFEPDYKVCNEESYEAFTRYPDWEVELMAYSNFKAKLEERAFQLKMQS